MNDDFERLQLQTKKKYVLDTFRNGLRRMRGRFFQGIQRSGMF